MSEMQVLTREKCKVCKGVGYHIMQSDNGGLYVCTGYIETWRSVSEVIRAVSIDLQELMDMGVDK